MADIFDTIASEPQGDVFDQVDAEPQAQAVQQASAQTQGDIFDQIIPPQLTRANVQPKENISDKFFRKMGEGLESATQPVTAIDAISPAAFIFKRLGALQAFPPFAFQDALAEKAGEKVVDETDSVGAAAITSGAINAINPLAIIKGLQVAAKVGGVAKATKALEVAKATKAAKFAEEEANILRKIEDSSKAFTPSASTKAPVDELDLFVDLFTREAQNKLPPLPLKEVAQADALIEKGSDITSFVEGLARQTLKPKDIERFIKKALLWSKRPPRRPYQSNQLQQKTL